MFCSFFFCFFLSPYRPTSSSVKWLLVKLHFQSSLPPHCQLQQTLCPSQCELRKQRRHCGPWGFLGAVCHSNPLLTCAGLRRQRHFVWGESQDTPFSSSISTSYLSLCQISLQVSLWFFFSSFILAWKWFFRFENSNFFCLFILLFVSLSVLLHRAEV